MNEFSNLGEQIKNTVQDAVDTMNFDHLNKNISDSVNSALFEVRNRLNINPTKSAGQKQGIHDWKVSMGQDPNQTRQEENNYYHSTKQANTGQANTTYTSNSSTQYTGQSNAQYTRQYNAQTQTDMWERRKQAAIDRANQMRRNQSYRKNASRQYTAQNSSMYQPQNASSTQLVPCPRRVPGRVSSIVLKGVGYSIGYTCLIGAVVVGIVGAATGAGVLSVIAQGLGFGAFFSLIAGMCGSKIGKRIRRFRQYITYIGSRKFCQIESLAAHTGYTKKFLLKDIKKMMQLGMFPQAHLDEKATCLILDNETYQQYLKTNAEYARKKLVEEEELKQEKKTKTKETTPEQEELRKTINEGRAYIRQINEANEAIPAIDISEKLSRLEQITSKIFAFVEQHPEQRSELRKFMEYYLPITLKLVNAYKELDAQPVQGDNIRSSKNEIVKTLDTINFAFENLLDSLYQSTAMEVSSDISVLEALFAQDGLTKKDFDLNKGGNDQ